MHAFEHLLQVVPQKYNSFCSVFSKLNDAWNNVTCTACMIHDHAGRYIMDWWFFCVCVRYCIRETYPLFGTFSTIPFAYLFQTKITDCKCLRSQLSWLLWRMPRLHVVGDQVTTGLGFFFMFQLYVSDSLYSQALALSLVG